MKIAQQIGWLVKASAILDYKFLSRSKWSAEKNIGFLITKYQLLIKHAFVPYKMGKSVVNFAGKNIFYGTRFGLSEYQSMLTRHQYLLSFIKPKKTPKLVLDIGANVGFFSLMIRDLYPKAEIIAVEPVKPIFDCLEANISGDKNAEAVNIGFSNKPAKLKMNFEEAHSDGSSINPNGNIEVKVVTLDNFLTKRKIKRIDILKIDVESHEKEVLLGGQKALAMTKYLVLEITIKNNNHYSISELMSMLYSDKYDFQLVSYRNYGDVSEGELPIIDAVFENIKL